MTLLAWNLLRKLKNGFWNCTDKIAFTGSNATGRKVMASASQVVKPVTMELGGKTPIHVFEDVDLDKAAEWTAFGCFWTNGQICSATSRQIVHENIAAAFLDGLVKWVKNIKVYDPFEEGCKLGLVISQGQEIRTCLQCWLQTKQTPMLKGRLILRSVSNIQKKTM